MRRLNLSKSPTLTPGAVDQLIAYGWPGNVRELDNIIERALIVGDGNTLRFDDLLTDKSTVRKLTSTAKLATLEQVTARHIRFVLDHTEGKVHGPDGAAELLGMNPSTLRYRMDKLGIRYGRSAKRGN